MAKKNIQELHCQHYWWEQWIRPKRAKDKRQWRQYNLKSKQANFLDSVIRKKLWELLKINLVGLYIPPIEFPTRCTGLPTTSTIKSLRNSAHICSLYTMFGFSDLPNPNIVTAQTCFPPSAMPCILSR